MNVAGEPTLACGLDAQPSAASLSQVEVAADAKRLDHPLSLAVEVFDCDGKLFVGLVSAEDTSQGQPLSVRSASTARCEWHSGLVRRIEATSPEV